MVIFWFSFFFANRAKSGLHHLSCLVLLFDQVMRDSACWENWFHYVFLLTLVTGGIKNSVVDLITTQQPATTKINKTHDLLFFLPLWLSTFPLYVCMLYLPETSGLHHLFCLVLLLDQVMYAPAPMLKKTGFTMFFLLTRKMFPWSSGQGWSKEVEVTYFLHNFGVVVCERVRGHVEVLHHFIASPEADKLDDVAVNSSK